jgi:hypothetical protein
VLYGPLILSFALIMLYIYGIEYKDDLEKASKTTILPMDLEKMEDEVT